MPTLASTCRRRPCKAPAFNAPAFWTERPHSRGMPQKAAALPLRLTAISPPAQSPAIQWRHGPERAPATRWGHACPDTRNAWHGKNQLAAAQHPRRARPASHPQATWLNAPRRPMQGHLPVLPVLPVLPAWPTFSALARWLPNNKGCAWRCTRRHRALSTISRRPVCASSQTPIHP